MMWVLASIASGVGKPVVIFERLAAQPQHPATRGFQELGKLNRSSYLLRYGTDMDLRGFVVPHTAKREHWNKFTREVQAFGDLVREKTLEDQEEVLWSLTVVQNAIVLWNALAIEDAVRRATAAGVKIDERALPHVHPTMTGQINFVGTFNLDLGRQPPFTFRRVVDLARAARKRKRA
jgi:TnpA family transposase